MKKIIRLWNNIIYLLIKDLFISLRQGDIVEVKVLSVISKYVFDVVCFRKIIVRISDGKIYWCNL